MGNFDRRDILRPFHALTKQGQILRLRRLAEKALCEFGIENAALVPLEHMANTTFRVEAADGGRYVMRKRHRAAARPSLRARNTRYARRWNGWLPLPATPTW